MTQPRGPREPAPNYEKSIKQLESIVRRLEQEEVPLEVSIKLFEEGQALVRACDQQLKAAENRIRQLIETPAGELTEAPFEPPSQETPAEPELDGDLSEDE